MFIGCKKKLVILKSIVYAGYPNDNLGLKNTYGLRDSVFKQVTQDAIHYYTDSMDRGPDRYNNDPNAYAAFQELIAARTPAPEDMTVKIYIPTNENYQTVVSTYFRKANSTVEVDIKNKKKPEETTSSSSSSSSSSETSSSSSSSSSSETSSSSSSETSSSSSSDEYSDGDSSNNGNSGNNESTSEGDTTDTSRSTNETSISSSIQKTPAPAIAKTGKKTPAPHTRSRIARTGDIPSAVPALVCAILLAASLAARASRRQQTQ